VSQQCPRCGKELPPEARFCLHCGKRLPRRSDAQGTIPQRLQRALGEEYDVQAEIGRGGFGVVYSVVDLRLDRRLAVKVIRPELVAADVINARFRREAQIAAQLNHPNVLAISFAGEGEGLVYCAMRQVIGDTLRERLKSTGPLPIDTALRIFGEMALGLAHAHERDIIHRDVKPANIMLDHDEADRAVLVDFGIAKALTPRSGKLSISGQIVGSPEYMSPERRAGAKTIDARSDIYSMGVVAFQMLTAHLPSGTETPSRSHTPVPRAISPDVRSLRSEVPEAFAKAMERCMLPLPEQRWGSALEAAEAAGAVLS
jgi:serine/threonine protein kinase